MEDCRLWKKTGYKKKKTSAGEVLRFILEFQLLNENKLRCDGALA